MADFSLTSVFVVPVGNTLPSSGSTQDLTAGQVGFFRSDYSVATSGNITGKPYFYVTQGRTNNYLQGSKRSDKISSTGTNVVRYEQFTGCSTPVNQVMDISGFNAKCGDILTLTIRAFSSYIQTLYFNGLTRSVTVQAPCCSCGADPCAAADVPTLIDKFIAKLSQGGPGINPDNLILSNFFQFQRLGNDANAILRITGKPLTKYGQPCDVAAFPFEFDRLWFRTFVYSGPATTADFIVADACNIVATSTVSQRADFAKGSSDEVAQLEKDYYSYQAAYLKHLNRMVGYNENFESWVTSGTTYDLLFIQFRDYDSAINYKWGDYIELDSTVIIASPQSLTSGITTVLNAALGTPINDGSCITITSTTTTVWPTTTMTSTLAP